MKIALMTCKRCGAEALKPKGQIFCGHRCAILFHQAVVLAAALTREARQKNANTRRGKGKSDSYIKRDGRHEHRLVAEQKLGRSLLPGEIAHHVDENKKNNAPSNIDVLPSQSEHARLHLTGTARVRPTHCKNGHPLSGDNLYVAPSSGSHVCITCRRAYDRVWKAERRVQQCA